MSAEMERELELARVKAALDYAKADANRLRGLWPRAELQRLYLTLGAQDAELAILRRDHAALAASTVARVPPPVFRVLELLRPASRAVRLALRLARVARSLPTRLPLRRQRRADAAVLAASPLFDHAWYRAHAMGNDARSDPVAHYLWLGCAAGHDPHPLFDSAWYAARHPALGLANPFADYLRRGMPLDEDPHPLFDAAYWISQSPEAAGRALTHYAARRAKDDTRSPAALFDPAAYAADHPEAADPLAHYARTPDALAWDPHPLFDAAWYRATYCGPHANPLAHWIREGAAQGLPPNGWGVRPGPLPSAVAQPAVSVVVLPSASAMATARTLLCAAAGAENVELILAATTGPALPGLRLLASNPGPHPCAQLNAAAQLARAPLVAVLPPGSIPQAGWLHPVLALLYQYPSAAIVVPGPGDGPACRITADAQPSALVIRTPALRAAGGFNDAYDGITAAASSLVHAVRGQGQEAWQQPASRVQASEPGQGITPADRARLDQQWAAASSAAPQHRRTVLVMAGPALATETTHALHALLRQEADPVLCTAEPDPAVQALGIGVLAGTAALDAWLAHAGDQIDEVWSFRPAAEVPVDLLLRRTGAALRHWTGAATPPGAAPRPDWCDAPLTPHDLHPPVEAHPDLVYPAAMPPAQPA